MIRPNTITRQVEMLRFIRVPSRVVPSSHNTPCNLDLSGDLFTTQIPKEGNEHVFKYVAKLIFPHLAKAWPISPLFPSIGK